MPRLFAGSVLSGKQQELLGELAQENDRLFSLWQRKLRWVRPAKLHLTWVFLGSVDESDVASVSAQLTELLASQPKLRITYERAQFWPSARKARQLVLTPHTVPDEVRELAGRIHRDLLKYTQKPDERDFKPHITLLRLESGARELGKAAALKLPDWLPLDRVLPLYQELHTISLIESHLGQSSGDYEILKDFQLG